MVNRYYLWYRKSPSVQRRPQYPAKSDLTINLTKIIVSAHITKMIITEDTTSDIILTIFPKTALCRSRVHLILKVGSRLCLATARMYIITAPSENSLLTLTATICRQRIMTAHISTSKTNFPTTVMSQHSIPPETAFSLKRPRCHISCRKGAYSSEKNIPILAAVMIFKIPKRY